MSNINGNVIGNINPQSDWNQSDITQQNYIKNKPFYKEDVTVNYTSIPYVEPNVNTGFSSYDKKLNLVANTTYTIDLVRDSGSDTIELTATSVSQYGLTAIVLQSSEITIIDGIIFDESNTPCIGNGLLYQINDTTIKNVKIYGIESTETVIHTIPQEYLNLDGLVPEIDINNYYEKESVNLFKDSDFTNGTSDIIEQEHEGEIFRFIVHEWPTWGLKEISTTAAISPCELQDGILTFVDTKNTKHILKQEVSTNNDVLTLSIEYLNSSYLKVSVNDEEIFNENYTSNVENLNIPITCTSDKLVISMEIDATASIKNPQLLEKIDSIVQYVNTNKFSGSYNDLTDIPESVQSDWNQNNMDNEDYIKNKPFYEEITTSDSRVFDHTISFDNLNNSASIIYREVKNSTLNLQIDNEYDIEYLDMAYDYMKSSTVCASFMDDKNDKTIPMLSVSSEFEIYDKATLDKDGDIIYGDGIVYKVIYEGAIKVKNIEYVKSNVITLDNKYLNVDELSQVIDTNGGVTNIDLSTIKGYNCGGIVKGFHPQSVDLVVCEVNHDTGEFISLKDMITATYDTSDPENRAAGIYTYKDVDYELSNVTSSTEVSEKLGFNDDERICLKVNFSDTSEIIVGMSYNLCYPANSKQRYGKVIAILENNEVIFDGECSAIHRSYVVNNIHFPTTSNQYNGNFIINGGTIGDFEITKSEGVSLHSEGIQSYASIGGHSEGYNTKALGFAAHAEGDASTASGYGSHAEGAATQSIGHQSHTEGERTEAHGYASHAEGQQSIATGSTSHAEGNMTLASGRIAHAEGNNTKATNNYAHSEGHYTEASGMASHAEGSNTKVISTYGHVEGNNNIVGQLTSNNTTIITLTLTPQLKEETAAMGIDYWYKTIESENDFINDTVYFSQECPSNIVINAINYIPDSFLYEVISLTNSDGTDGNLDDYSINVDIQINYITSGVSAHAEGQDSKALEDFSHAEGRGTTASGIASHAEGQGTKATEKQAHAEGYNTEAFGDRAHAEGNSTKAHGSMSHAEGYLTEATGQYTHGEGWLSKATGQVGHAEGYKTVASGRFSHAEGRETLASGTSAHASGLGTIANGPNQVASGKYNKSHSTHLHIVGKGTSDTDRINAYVLNKDGAGYFAGDVYVGDATTLTKAKKLATEEYVSNKIIYPISDIIELPTIEINENALYRLITAEVVFDKFINTKESSILCYCVNGLPEEGLPVTNSTSDEINVYYNIQDKNASGYITDELSTMLGISSGWYDLFTLCQALGFTYNGIIYNTKDIVENGFYILLTVSLYHYKDRWICIDNIIGMNGTGYYSEIFNDYINNVASGSHAHAEGSGTQAVGHRCHAEGSDTQAIGYNSHTEGEFTYAEGEASHAEGSYTQANGVASHAEGNRTVVSGSYAHAEGSVTQADGVGSHAEGDNTKALSDYAHAEGCTTEASGQYTHSEGWLSKATGQAAHAEGYKTQAIGNASHAEGESTIVTGQCAHAEGCNTNASGAYSHAEGHGTLARHNNQHVQGKFNIEDTENKYAHIVGNGLADIRSNAHTLDWDGNAWYAGSISAGRETNDDDNDLTLVTKGYLKTMITNAINEVLGVTEADEGKFLKVVDGKLAWFDINATE